MVENLIVLKTSEKEKSSTQDQRFELLDSNDKVIAGLNLYKTYTEIFLERFKGSLGEEMIVKLRKLPMFGDLLETKGDIPHLEIMGFLASSHKDFYDSQDGSYLWLSHDYKSFHPENTDHPNVIEYMCSSDCPIQMVSEYLSPNGIYSALVLFNKESNA